MKQEEPKKKPMMELLFGGLSDQEKDDMLELKEEFQMWRLASTKTKLANMREANGERRSAKKRKK